MTSFTLRVEELSRFCISADLGSSGSGGRISLALKPGEEINPVPTVPAGVLVHFETVEEMGKRRLRVFTSIAGEDDGSAGSMPASDSATIPEPSGHLDFPSEGSYPGTEMEVPSSYYAEDYMLDLSSPDPGSSSFFRDSVDIFGPAVDKTQPDYTTLWDDFQCSMLDEDLLQDSEPPYPAPAASYLDMLSFPSPALASTPSEDSLLPNSPESTNSISDSDAKSTPEPTTVPPDARPRPRSQVGAQRPRRLACLQPDCTRRFMSEYTRKIHMESHKPKPRHPCEMGCSMTFSRQHDRVRHEVSKHGRSCQWQCNRCCRFFSSQETQDKHKCPANGSAGSRWTVQSGDHQSSSLSS